jgi:hypothetical protein
MSKANCDDPRDDGKPALRISAKAREQDDGTFQIEDDQLHEWIHNINEAYTFFREGKPSAVYGVRAERLQEIGFVFRYDFCEAPGKPRMYKTWRESFNKLQVYMDREQRR